MNIITINLVLALKLELSWARLRAIFIQWIAEGNEFAIRYDLRQSMKLTMVQVALRIFVAG